MSASFAGSRCVDDRRRRRLAQGAELTTPEPSRSGSAPRGGGDSAEVEAATYEPASPVESLIPFPIWRSVLLAVLGLVAWGAVLYVGQHVDRARPSLSGVLGLRSGLACRFFSSTALLAASVLSYVIYWFRSRSPKDFPGRYRIWAWAVPIWLIFGVAAATDLHHVAGSVAMTRWQVNVWNAATLCWMVPAAIAVLGLTRLLHWELRGCRLSLSLLWCSSLVAIVAATSVLAGEVLWDEPTRVLMQRGATTLWQFLLGATLVFHARHVLYVNDEPPALRPGLRLLTWLTVLRRRRADRESAPVRARAGRLPAEPAPRHDEAAERTSAPHSARPAPASAAVRRREPAADGTPPSVKRPLAAASTPVASAEPRPEPTRRAPASRAAAAATATLDLSDEGDSEEDDPSEFSSLTKKERRRMRKLQRQREQAGSFAR